MEKSLSSRKFQELPLEEQSAYIFERPLSQRAELISLSQNPARFVVGLSFEELLFITKETDREGVRELAQFATPDQLVFLTDSNCWDDDSVDEDSFVKWLADLLEIGIEKLTSTVRNLDYEFLVAALKKCVEIIKTQHEEAIDEIVGDDPYFTIDNLYYIRLNHEDDFRTLKVLFEVIFDKDKDLYFDIVEGILSEVDSEIEEDAFQLRGERLAEKGFPTVEEAYRIYSPLSVDEFLDGEKKEIDDVDPDRLLHAEFESASHLPVASAFGGFLFDEALARVSAQSTPAVEHIGRELMWIVNKVIVCSKQEINANLLAKSAARARSYISLGLDVVSGGNVEKAADVLSSYWLEHIFSVGYTQLLNARQALASSIRKVWKGDIDILTAFFGEPYGTTLERFLDRYPQIVDPGEDTPRDMCCVQDLEVFSEFAALVDGVLRLLLENNLVNWPSMFDEERDGMYLNMEEGVFSLPVLLATVFVRYSISSRIELSVVNINEFSQFLSAHCDECSFVLKPQEIEDFKSSVLGKDGLAGGPVSIIIDSVLKRLADEFADFTPDLSVDPNFVDLVLLESDVKAPHLF